MTTKELIIKTLHETGRENIENVIAYMEKNGFFSRHCNRHHHYEGGLADHAWQAYQFAKQIEADERAKNLTTPSIKEDSLAICALLHDFCKCRGMQHHHGHGWRSAAMLKELGLHLSPDEFLAIRYHMRLSTHTTDRLYEDAQRCLLRSIIHEADGKSAKMRIGIATSNP